MTIAKVRSLSKYGVLTDVDPLNLPTEAFSMAVNIRFENGSVIQGPVFRRVPVTLSQSDPRYVVSNIPTSGFDTIFIGYKNGRVSSYKTTETDVSIAGFVNNVVELPYSSCHLADVFYVNRGDRVPWSLTTVASQFVTLANWDATWRAKLLRACGGALLAFGITKGASVFPTMVKTSDFVKVPSTVPTSWDHTLTTNNATENILTEMEGQIIDAANFGEVMMIYGLNETWRMEPTGGSDVWAYHKLFSDAGAINANCALEYDKKQYVFGPTDIWVHDGVSKKSICDLRVRKFVYSNINLQKSGFCHVAYDRNEKKIRFNFVSGDRVIQFTGVDGCNRSAVYDPIEDTWTFDDLPFTFSAGMANIDTTATYATVTSTYEAVGGTYLDQEDGLKRVLCAVGASASAYGLSTSLYAIDRQGPGSLVSYDVDINALKTRILEKDGIDLDGLPELEDVDDYKIISSIFPQGRLEFGASPMIFSFLAADNFGGSLSSAFSSPQTYDGNTETRCDFYEAGRYLFMRMQQGGIQGFTLNGIDLDVHVDGET